MVFRHDGPTSFLDCIAGAIIGAFFVGITVLLIPFVLAAHSWSHGMGLFSFMNSHYALPFFLWCSVVTAVAFLAGLILGSGRTIELLGHLWGTYEPRSTEFTFKLWSGIAISALIPFALVFPWMKLLRGFGIQT